METTKTGGTLHDVSRLSGLSIATISKYLNGVRVKEGNEKKIKRAIEECNYNVNFFARGLKTGHSMTIGVLVPSIASVFYSSLVAEVERIMMTKGYTLYVSGYDNNAAQENEKFRMLLSRKADAILIAPEKLDMESLALARKNKTPVLFFDTVIENAGVGSVTTNNREVCRRVTQELIERGFQNIAVLAPNSLYSTTRERCIGCREALEQAGVHNVNIVSALRNSVSGSYEITKSLLAGAHPDAVFTLSSSTFLGALMAINEEGLRIPQDIAFIGFDNQQISHIYTPNLSLIYQPLDEIAGIICDRLTRLIKGEEDDGSTVVESRVVYTESVSK